MTKYQINIRITAPTEAGTEKVSTGMGSFVVYHATIIHKLLVEYHYYIGMYAFCIYYYHSPITHEPSLGLRS